MDMYAGGDGSASCPTDATSMHEEDTNAHPSMEEVYDVVICGTDLIQSVLSSALSRAGKRVLHCDGREWYGGFDAVLHAGSTLDSFIGECERFACALARERVELKCNDDDNKDADSPTLLHLLPEEKQGDLRVHSQTFVAASIDFGTMENLDSKTDVENTNNGNTTTDSSSVNETNQPSVHPLEKGFCFDITPNLLYASGDAVDGLVKSEVSEYLEFKSLKGLYLLTEDQKSSMTTKGRRGHGRSTAQEKPNNCDGDDVTAVDKRLAIYRVPCSKADVFRSELLSPIDKRRLMKFLQLILDYGMATQGGGDDQSSSNPVDDASDNQNRGDEADDNHVNANTNPDLGEDTVKSVNERYLHRGRALSRPQNKAMPSSSDMDALLRSIRDKLSFSDYLTQVAKLPARLSNVILYAMALAPFGSSGCDKAGVHNDSSTDQASQYSTKDGVDDLVRHLTALGRFGDTAFLVPMYGSGELSQAFCRSGAVYGSTYMLRRSPTAVSIDSNARVQAIILKGEHHIGGKYDDLDTDDVSDKTIHCKHVIVPSTMMRASPTCTKIRTYRRISVLQGKLMLDQVQNNDSKDCCDTDQRHAIIIPPGTSSLGNTSAINGVAVDESAFVAPPGRNYTVLHLSTSSQEVDGAIDELSLNSLSEAVNYLIVSRSNKDDAPCQECHHIAFSYATDASSPADEDTNHPLGLHICHRGKQSLTVDSAFREARRIFEIICPDSEFLALAKQVEDKVVYRDNHDDDDEKDVLESACTMIQAPAQEKLPAKGNSTEIVSGDDS
ncbi:hypothetical protein ACHAXH_008467 [Discostella pseudostelligera]